MNAYKKGRNEEKTVGTCDKSHIDSGMFINHDNILITFMPTDHNFHTASIYTWLKFLNDWYNDWYSI